MHLRHLQLNIKNTMSPWAIRSDVDKAFSLDPDTIVFNECRITHHEAIRRNAAEKGYGVYIAGRGARGQVVLCWKKSRFDASFKRSTYAAKGRKHVQPSRYVQRVSLVDRQTHERVNLVGTHTVASGWTGRRFLDVWRRLNWHGHELVMAGVLRWVVRHNAVVIWSGDMNRPPHTFKGRLFPHFHPRGLKTDLIVKTNATHYRAIYDYVGVLSKHRNVRVVSWKTVPFHSDHDGVLVDLEWEC